MQVSNAVDITSRTWAVRPQSEALTDLPPLPDWQLALSRSSESTRRSPSAAPQDTECSSGDDSDTPKPRTAQKSDPRSRLAYKPSFSKATFQWMRGELLGQGSYGRVYLALNATTGEIMAVKQVEFPKTPSDRIKSRQLDVMKALKFESATLKDLDHANIVQYLGYEESEDFLSIFLEYVPGGTISELLRQHGRFREEVTTSFLSQILQGLDYLHSSNILHRDLKADNILVEESGVCKISDFGISKKANDLSSGGRAYTMMKGTVYWMAPEVLASDGQGYDAKVDIWSVGCVAVEMWTGTRPWSGYQTAPVMLKLYKEKQGPPIPSDISLSPLANDFRENCFHTDPRQRPHARTLKKHPYLQQPAKGWVFDITDIADTHRNRRPPAIPGYSYPSLYPDNSPRFSRDSSSTLRPSQPSTRGTARPNLPTLSIPEFPVQTLTQERWRAAEPPSGTLGPGPPLVTITPPGSPKSQPKEYSYLPYSASEVTSSRRIRPRKLIIANPDEGSDELRRNRVSRKPTFTYTPPPLPDPTLQPTSATSPSKTPVSGHSSSFASTRIPHATNSPSLSSSPPSAQVEHSSKLPDRTPSTWTHVPSSAISPSLSSSPPSALVEPPSSSNRPLTSKPSIRSPRPLPPSPAGHATSTTSATATTHQQAYHSCRDRPHTATSSSSSHHPLPLPQSSAASRHGYGTAYKAAHSTSSTSTSSITSSISSSTTALGKPTARPLPMSPPRKLRASSSIAHLPGSSGNRMLMKQKSVPDVSIFAFDPAAQRNGGKSFSVDSELEDEYEGLMASNNAGRAGGATSINRSRFIATCAAANNTGKNGGRQRESTTSMAMRPKMEEVVEHLESWFPNHDLDQPVGDPGGSSSTSTTAGLVRPGSSASTSSGSGSCSQQTDQQQLIRQQQLQQQQQRKADGRKSIRMIAKEQARKSHGDPSRRRTRLWNSSVKELKHQP